MVYCYGNNRRDQQVRIEQLVVHHVLSVKVAGSNPVAGTASVGSQITCTPRMGRLAWLYNGPIIYR